AALLVCTGPSAQSEVPGVGVAPSEAGGTSYEHRSPGNPRLEGIPPVAGLHPDLHLNAKWSSRAVTRRGITFARYRHEVQRQHAFAHPRLHGSTFSSGRE